MAITIQDQPANDYIRPAFAPIEYLVSSDNTAQSGFKIVCKVYLNPTGANTLISTQQINVRPSSTQAILSIQDVVKSFVPIEYNALENSDTTELVNIPLNDFNVTFQEYYSGALQGSIVTSNTIKAYSSSPKYIQFASNEWQDYQITTASDKNFLSGFDNTLSVMSVDLDGFTKSMPWLKVKESQRFQIQFLQVPAVTSEPIQWAAFDKDLNFVRFTHLTYTASAKSYLTMDAGRQEIGANNWGSGLNWSTIKYYALYINHAYSAPYSKVYLYELDDCDTNYTPYELHWLNRWGGFDSFVFDGKSNQTTDINKTFAKYSPDRINGTSLSYSTSAQRTRAFNTATSESYSLNSRLLKDFEVKGLEDLISSPEVYWRSEAGFVSANVSGRTYQHAKSENGLVFSLALDMTIDNSDERQW